MLRWKKMRPRDGAVDAIIAPPSSISSVERSAGKTSKHESEGEKNVMIENVPPRITVNIVNYIAPSSASSISSIEQYMPRGNRHPSWNDDETFSSTSCCGINYSPSGNPQKLDSSVESNESSTPGWPRIAHNSNANRKRKVQYLQSRQVSSASDSLSGDVLEHSTSADVHDEKTHEDNGVPDTAPPNKKIRVSSPSQDVSANEEKTRGETIAGNSSTDPQSSPNVLLLATPDDVQSLNPLHIFIRSQIEVFTATSNDIAQPAPGRKNPVRINQVGLRCIHCRHLSPRDRVKRAVCYPSSVGRVYHSVSDMKFDHFNNCKGMNKEVRSQLQTLRETYKRRGNGGGVSSDRNGNSASSTAQYYHDSARLLGMENGKGGVFMNGNNKNSEPSTWEPDAEGVRPTVTVEGNAPMAQGMAGRSGDRNLKTSFHKVEPSYEKRERKICDKQEDSGRVARSGTVVPSPQTNKLTTQGKNTPTGGSFPILSSPANTETSSLQIQVKKDVSKRQDVPIQKFNECVSRLIPAAVPVSLPPSPQFNSLGLINDSLNDATARDVLNPTALQALPHDSRPSLGSTANSILLSTPNDPLHLNALHCFVRRNVEVFIATPEDIAAPAPGRKNRVTVGQVGIRCIHCANLPPKDRVKRAICYPPSVSGIYHSVSNMKFDHFGGCRGLPDLARQEFTTLRAQCTRRGGSTSGGSNGSSIGASFSGQGGPNNSTARYYEDSARSLGLIDTKGGIRFRDNRILCRIPSEGNETPQKKVMDPGSTPPLLDSVMKSCPSHSHGESTSNRPQNQIMAPHNPTCIATSKAITKSAVTSPVPDVADGMSALMIAATCPLFARRRAINTFLMMQ